MGSRAHARRRLAAWDRYRRRWRHDPRVCVGDCFRWWVRAGVHRPDRRSAGRS